MEAHKELESPAPDVRNIGLDRNGTSQPNPVAIIGKIFATPSVTENLVARRLANQRDFGLLHTPRVVELDPLCLFLATPIQLGRTLSGPTSSNLSQKKSEKKEIQLLRKMSAILDHQIVFYISYALRVLLKLFFMLRDS